MTVAVKSSGSQTSTAATEHTLDTITDPGVYQLAVDANALTSAASLILRVYGKARSGDTERLIWEATFFGANLGPPLKVSPGIISPHSYRVSLECSAGSLAFPWGVYST